MMRILIVDDNESIHNDFKKVLHGKSKDKLRNVEMALFGEDDPDFEHEEPVIEYQIDDAFQGEDAIEMVDRAAAEGRPYALIFMDVRMPPGMDGIQASARIWERHPEVELVICTAHSDYSWGEMVKEIGASDKLQFLRKPFDMVTVQQMALACVKKYEARLEEEARLKRLREENERQKQNQANFAAATDEMLRMLREAQTEMDALDWLAKGDAARGTGLTEAWTSRSAKLRTCIVQITELTEKTKETLGCR